MTAPAVGACNPSWTTQEAVEACCPGLAATPDPGLMDLAIKYASQILYRASGRQFNGPCTVEHARPCMGNGCGCGGWSSALGWDLWRFGQGGWVTISAGVIYNVSLCGTCAGVCDLPSVDLPGPVSSVEEVVIDGEILDPSAYEVWNYRQLVRTDGGTFPCSNNRELDSAAGTGEVGTWEVSFTFGREPDEVASQMAAIYACQISLLWCNGVDSNCRLPYRVQTAQREGFTLQFVDPSLFLQNGMTGIGEVDAWIRSMNPNGNQRRARASRLGRAVGLRHPTL